MIGMEVFPICLAQIPDMFIYKVFTYVFVIYLYRQAGCDIGTDNQGWHVQHSSSGRTQERPAPAKMRAVTRRRQPPARVASHSTCSARHARTPSVPLVDTSDTQHARMYSGTQVLRQVLPMETGIYLEPESTDSLRQRVSTSPVHVLQVSISPVHVPV